MTDKNYPYFSNLYFQELIESKKHEIQNLIRVEAKAEASFQEEIKKLAEFNQRHELVSKKLKDFQEFNENFQNTIAKEMYVREQEAKAHEEWMRQIDAEEQSKFETYFGLTRAGKMIN